MPSLESPHIVRRLFDEYYAKSGVADEHTSSHWRELHQDARVEIDGEKIIKLAGSGFGDLQNTSLVYRTFSGLTIFCYLLILKNRFQIIRLLPSALRLSRKMGLHFTYDAFRQVCVVVALKPYLRVKAVRILNIGDGYGFFSALIKNYYPDAKIICVDLGKTLLFQAHYCQRAFPASIRCLAGEQSIAANVDFVFCPAEDLESLSGEKFDLAVNIASMQEMNSETLRRYFQFLRRTLNTDGHFYCCNREEKVMSGGEVSRLSDYPWKAGDKNIWDEVCPWYRFFLSSHRTPKGPRIGNMRVPFMNTFDGVVRHRLVKLASTA